LRKLFSAFLQVFFDSLKVNYLTSLAGSRQRKRLERARGEKREEKKQKNPKAKKVWDRCSGFPMCSDNIWPMAQAYCSSGGEKKEQDEEAKKDLNFITDFIYIFHP